MGEARRLLAGCPSCHDLDHTMRVRRNALILARAEGADATVVEVAALLHDIGRPQELEDEGRTDHAVLGAKMVFPVLEALGVRDADFVKHVSSCVLTHRFRRRNPGRVPETIEAQCVFDADKLDSIGAIGIARSMHFAGRIGARVHNTAQEALGSGSYSTEDSAYREYLVKLRFLKDSMLTATGRAMAMERHRFMEEFFEELNREAYGTQDLG